MITNVREFSARPLRRRAGQVLHPLYQFNFWGSGFVLKESCGQGRNLPLASPAANEHYNGTSR
jgi:hypothetical protein